MTYLLNIVPPLKEVCKHKFIKIEQGQAQKNEGKENKFAKIEEDIENLKLSDDIIKLESEHDH